jgi:uncharacterized protein (TIGR02145 family)
MKKNTLFLSLLFYSITLFSQSWTCGDSLVDNRDGRVYNTILIDNQCWMAENLNYGTMILNTGPGQLMNDNGTVEKYCWNNDSDYCNGANGKEKKGAFYEWSEAVQYYGGQPAEPVQGICPEGWHVPSNTEFTALINFAGGLAVAGTALKPGGSTGFDGQLVGYRCTLAGSFLPSAIGANGVYYWTSKQGSAAYAKFYGLESGQADVWTMDFYKTIGISVRCIKNESSSIDQIKDEQPQLNIINNHEDNLITLKFISRDPGYWKLVVADVFGRELINRVIPATKGENLFSFSSYNFACGIYNIFIQNGEHFTSGKVIVK